MDRSSSSKALLPNLSKACGIPLRYKIIAMRLATL